MSHTIFSDFDIPTTNEIKPSRWVTLDEQLRFIEFLNEVGLRELTNDGKLSWCASIVEKYHCGFDQNHSIHVKYRLCGKRGICPRCSKAYAQKRASIMYQWIKNNLASSLDFDLKLNQITLTLPESLHGMDRKQFVKMISQMMAKMRIEAYGYVIQNDHSENPLSDEYLHVHILTLNMKKENDRLVRNDYFFDLVDMRNKWKSVIENNTGVKIDGDVNLHNEYASVLNDRPKVLHMLAYCYRYPVEDLFNVQIRKQTRDYSLVSLDYYVQTQQIEKEPRPYNILQIDLANRIKKLIENKPRLVWCGWLTSAKRNELTELLQMPKQLWNNLKYYEQRTDERAKQCRDCGERLEEKPFLTTEYTGDNEPVIFTTERTSFFRTPS